MHWEKTKQTFRSSKRKLTPFRNRDSVSMSKLHEGSDTLRQQLRMQRPPSTPAKQPTECPSSPAPHSSFGKLALSCRVAQLSRIPYVPDSARKLPQNSTAQAHNQSLHRILFRNGKRPEHKPTPLSAMASSVYADDFVFETRSWTRHTRPSLTLRSPGNSLPSFASHACRRFEIYAHAAGEEDRGVGACCMLSIPAVWRTWFGSLTLTDSRQRAGDHACCWIWSV